MQVTLLDYTPDAENKIGAFAGICYDGKTDEASNRKRAAHCLENGHLSTLRFAYATVNISGISRVCSHQLVRIAHAGVLQRSQRYVDEKKFSYFLPDSVMEADKDLAKRVNALHKEAQELYLKLLQVGVKKQDARYIIPQSVHTEINVSMNFQAWGDFLKNRLDKAAQQEIREVANEINRLLNTIAPNIFKV